MQKCIHFIEIIVFYNKSLKSWLLDTKVEIYSITQWRETCCYRKIYQNPDEQEVPAYDYSIKNCPHWQPEWNKLQIQQHAL